MNFNIAVLPGDGIGPEIIEQAKKVVLAVCKRFKHSAVFNLAWWGQLPLIRPELLCPRKPLICADRQMQFFSELSATPDMIIIPPLRSGPSKVFSPCEKNLAYMQTSDL